MEFKGTKGKWVAESYDDDSNGWISVKTPVGNITIYGVCTTGVNKEGVLLLKQEAEANAKLIASAPEMLEALKEALSTLNKDFSKGDIIDLEINLREIIKQATN